MNDAAAVQIAQPGARIGSDGQAAAPRQLGGCRCLIAGSSQAVVQASTAAVLCTAIKQTGGDMRSSHLMHVAQLPASCSHFSKVQGWFQGTPVIRAGGSATSPMN